MFEALGILPLVELLLVLRLLHMSCEFCLEQHRSHLRLLFEELLLLDAE